MYQLSSPESSEFLSARRLELVREPEVNLFALVLDIQQAEQDEDHIRLNNLFSEFYVHTQNDAHGCAMKYMKNKDDAEVATQEAYIRAYNGIGGFGFNSSPKTWLYTIVRNVSVTALTKQQRVRVHEGFFGNDEMPELSSIDPFDDPEACLREEELKAEFDKALISLEPIHQNIMGLSMGGLTHKQMAEKLEISEGAIKSRLSRARCVLRPLLNPQISF